MPGASAFRVLFFTFRRKHVVVHSHHHRDEDDRVIEKVKLDTGDPKLRETGGNRGMKPIMTGDRLVLQNTVLDVMPELNPEGDHPPRIGNTREALAEYPDANEHDQGIAVM